MINKQLGDLNLMKNFGCTVTRIRRSGIDLSPSPDLALKFGDKLMVVGEKDGIKGVARLLGNDTKQLSDTDLLPHRPGHRAGRALRQAQHLLLGQSVVLSGTDGRNFDDGSFLECYWKDRTYYLVNVRTG